MDRRGKTLGYIRPLNEKATAFRADAAKNDALKILIISKMFNSSWYWSRLLQRDVLCCSLFTDIRKWTFYDYDLFSYNHW